MPRNGEGRYHRTAPRTDTFGGPDREQGVVSVEVGGGHVEVPVGADFVNTIEQVAREHHFGGYFRVFVNSNELVNPGDAPGQIEAGMRIALTSYDKVGHWQV